VDAEVLAEPKKIKVRLQHADPVTIKGDALRLRQLFLNLVDNAVKYTPDRGSITISLIRQNGNALFTIKDTGIGIPRKDVGRIFERFYRVEQSSNGNIPGSGLGLSIAKWIAEAHQGSIDVKSREHRGSTFVVSLPLQELPLLNSGAP
ncbi:MAG: ATP-binding protein, partial [Bacteroidota bacterium]